MTSNAAYHTSKISNDNEDEVEEPMPIRPKVMRSPRKRTESVSAAIVEPEVGEEPVSNENVSPAPAIVETDGAAAANDQLESAPQEKPDEPADTSDAVEEDNDSAPLIENDISINPSSSRYTNFAQEDATVKQTSRKWDVKFAIGLIVLVIFVNVALTILLDTTGTLTEDREEALSEIRPTLTPPREVVVPVPPAAVIEVPEMDVAPVADTSAVVVETPAAAVPSSPINDTGTPALIPPKVNTSDTPAPSVAVPVEGNEQPTASAARFELNNDTPVVRTPDIMAPPASLDVPPVVAAPPAPTKAELKNELLSILTQTD